MSPPDLPFCHEGSQFRCVSCSSVTLEGVQEGGLGSSSTSMSVFGLPEDQWLCAELRVSEAMSSELHSSGGDFVRDLRKFAIQNLIGSVA